jgi:rubrerythrin
LPRTRISSAARFSLFQGAANGLFAEVPNSCAGVNDAEALLIGIRCERGSYRFFKRYGERFEDSEGKRIFLEFAAEERTHLNLLIREYRSLRERQGGVRRKRRPARHAAH